MSDSMVCLDCNKAFTMTEDEVARFEHLIQTVPNFHMPRRCPACRKNRRAAQFSSTPQQAIPIPVSPIAVPPVLPAPVTEMPKPEVKLVLATKDFEDLVHGRPVVWQGVRVILADIGFKTMRDAIDRAEMERAKAALKTNGSVV